MIKAKGLAKDTRSLRAHGCQWRASAAFYCPHMAAFNLLMWRPKTVYAPGQKKSQKVVIQGRAFTWGRWPGIPSPRSCCPCRWLLLRVSGTFLAPTRDGKNWGNYTPIIDLLSLPVMRVSAGIKSEFLFIFDSLGWTGSVGFSSGRKMVIQIVSETRVLIPVDFMAKKTTTFPPLRNLRSSLISLQFVLVFPLFLPPSPLPSLLSVTAHLFSQLSVVPISIHR